MVKIGAELPKLSKKKTGGPFFWTTLYLCNQNMWLYSSSTKIPEFESSLQYWISPQRLHVRLGYVH